MNKELDEQLCREFPNLYRQRNGSMRSTAMCWGFECGNGWFQIIYDLSKELEAEILKLPEADREYCCASQVKEKYGTLRFYTHSETDEMSNLIREAGDKSYRTCETCGKPGQYRGWSWYHVSCEEHSDGELTYKEYIKEYNKDHPEENKTSFKDHFYFITRWFKYPSICVSDLKSDLKWSWWKLKRRIKRALSKISH